MPIVRYVEAENALGFKQKLLAIKDGPFHYAFANSPCHPDYDIIPEEAHERFYAALDKEGAQSKKVDRSVVGPLLDEARFGQTEGLAEKVEILFAKLSE